MMNKKLSAMVLGGVLLSASLLTACSASGAEPSAVAEDCEPIASDVEVTTEGKLTVAVAEYPTYVSMATGELTGSDGELINHIAERLCLDVDAQTQSFTAIIETVKSGRADLTAGNWYITPERETEFEISDPVYRDQVVIISEDGISTLEGLEGLTVSATQGYSTIPDLQAALGQENLKLYATEEAGFQDLNNGRVDAAVMTAGAAQHMLNVNEGSNLKVEVFEETPEVADTAGDAKNYVLIPKGNTNMQAAVNEILAEVREDGTMVEILERNGFDASAADVED